MTNTNIKTILAKGKLTGEEVGRIFLRDYARFLGAIQSEQAPPKDKFTDAEKQAMVNGITEPYEIKQYSTYIGILQFLQKMGILYNGEYRQLKYLLMALSQQIEQAKNIDIVRLLLADAPLILTEKQYKRLKQLKQEEAFITSFISIIPEEEIKEWDNWKREHYLDKDGNYKYQLSDHERTILTELLPNTIKRVKSHLIRLFAIQEIYRILGEELGEESIIELASDRNYIFKDTDTDGLGTETKKHGLPNRSFLYWFIVIINEEINDFKRILHKTSPVIDQATIKEIHEAVNALPEIKIKELRPKKEAINRVKELTKDLDYYGAKGLSLFDILAGIV